MSDTFREFVSDEINAIMDSMDEDCKNDPTLCQKNAMEWIKNNAKRFRQEWLNTHEPEADMV